MARIVTVYYPGVTRFKLQDMSFIRWLKISEALARRGHKVDIATNEPHRLHGWWRRHAFPMAPGLRRVPLRGIDYSHYEVVKTLFHIGFETVLNGGGGDHPFIVAKLGSVVGPTDMEGIYFYGSDREKQFQVQQKMAQHARYITVLSEAAGELWRETVSHDNDLLLVPGAVDAHIPGRARDPFPSKFLQRCLFSGHIYSSNCQGEANRVLVDKLNQLGRCLARYGIRLFFQGTGDTSALDSRYVSNLGTVAYEDSWQAMLFAQAGIVVSAGPFMHNNESTKIYHYLRAGLPVISESGFPNDHLVTSTGLGQVVENGNMEAMAAAVADTMSSDWDRDAAIEYILLHHTWDKRAEVYDKVIRETL